MNDIETFIALADRLKRLTDPGTYGAVSAAHRKAETYSNLPRTLRLYQEYNQPPEEVKAVKEVMEETAARYRAKAMETYNDDIRGIKAEIETVRAALGAACGKAIIEAGTYGRGLALYGPVAISKALNRED